MPSPLLAAGWAEFLRLLPFVIAFLIWVIGRVATQLPQKPPQRGGVPPRPLPPQAPKKVGDSLQGEISEFLRQAQAAREGRGAKPGQAPAAQFQGSIAPASGRPSDARQKRVARWPAQSDRDSRSQEKRPMAPPPVIAKASGPQSEAVPPRESVAQHVTETLDSSKFARRATQLSQVQESTDSDFRRHMDRVFQHDLGNLKKETGGIFEAAGAAAHAATDAAAAKLTAAAAGRNPARLQSPPLSVPAISHSFWRAAKTFVTRSF